MEGLEANAFEGVELADFKGKDEEYKEDNERVSELGRFVGPAILGDSFWGNTEIRGESAPACGRP